MNITRYKLRTDLPPLPEGYPISAVVVSDSINEIGDRLTTLEIVFPRYILSEFNTHRAFSRNTSSSRAIPTKKQIAAAESNPVVPVRWGKNQSGMQASKENLEGEALNEAREIWLDLVKYTANACSRMADLSLHKQWASRPLEWFTTTKMVVSFTDFNNFAMLRDHEAAQDEIAYLAQAMKTALNNSTPRLVVEGRGAENWHIPYVTEDELKILGLNNALKVSAARCARTSYKTQLGVTSTLEEDVGMFKRLTSNMEFGEENPFHASPTEHQARVFIRPRVSNFNGWVQLRQDIEWGLFS